MKFLLSLLFFILLPLDAWAFIPHEYPAIYVHMLSLIYCFVALIIVLWAFILRGLYKERRWKYLFLAAIFHAIWNANVIIGRVAEALWIEKSRIIGNTEGWQYFARQITIEGFEYFYYIGRLDFILLDIAMLFFYIWLREHLRKETESHHIFYFLFPGYQATFCSTSLHRQGTRLSGKLFILMPSAEVLTPLSVFW